jgi:ankyrin repeat protein
MHAHGQAEGPLRDLIVDFLGKVAAFRKCTFQVWHSAPWNFLDWPKKPSALWIAAATNLVETAEFLIEHRLSVQDVDIQRSTPLQVASYYGHLPMIQLLIQSASVNAQAG